MARRRWTGARRTPRSATAAPAVLPGCSPADQVLRLTCALCSREAKGFGYVHQLRLEAFPHYRFCSLRCCQAGTALGQRRGGVIDKTPMEARAIQEARRFFAEVLAELDLLAPFHNRSAAEIDRIIEACVDGFQSSMQRQAAERDPLDDPIPF